MFSRSFWQHVFDFLMLWLSYVNFASLKYHEMDDDTEQVEKTVEAEAEDEDEDKVFRFGGNEDEYDSINIDLLSKKEKLSMLQKEYYQQKNKLTVLKLCENVMKIEDDEDENLFNLLLDEQYDVNFLCLILQKSLNEYSGLKED